MAERMQDVLEDIRRLAEQLRDSRNAEESRKVAHALRERVNDLEMAALREKWIVGRVLSHD